PPRWWCRTPGRSPGGPERRWRSQRERVLRLRRAPRSVDGSSVSEFEVVLVAVLTLFAQDLLDVVPGLVEVDVIDRHPRPAPPLGLARTRVVRGQRRHQIPFE